MDARFCPGTGNVAQRNGFSPFLWRNERSAGCARPARLVLDCAARRTPLDDSITRRIIERERARSQRRQLAVFDSGIGGLGVVREIRRLLPAADIVYVADNGGFPYGNLPDAAVV